MPEEKELTIEEMKSLVALSTILPPLLDNISSIEKQIKELKTAVNDLQLRFDHNTKAFIAYKKNVDEIIDDQIDPEYIEVEITAIKESLLRLEQMYHNDIPLTPKKTTSKKPSSVIEAKKKEESAKEDKPTKEEKTASTKEDENKKKELELIQTTVDKILAQHHGQKKRILTKDNVKNLSKCNDEVADKILAFLTNCKMYDPKSQILVFPKR